MLVAEIALALSALHLEREQAEGRRGRRRDRHGRRARTTSGCGSRYLRATHATGDPGRLEAAAAALIDRSHAVNGPARGLPPRVEALLDELLPSWRGSIAN